MPLVLIPINSVLVSDAVIADNTIYCMTVIDLQNQIFTGIEAKTKTLIRQFAPGELVGMIPFPGLGAKILAFTG